MTKWDDVLVDMLPAVRKVAKAITSGWGVMVDVQDVVQEGMLAAMTALHSEVPVGDDLCRVVIYSAAVRAMRVFRRREARLVGRLTGHPLDAVAAPSYRPAAVDPLLTAWQDSRDRRQGWHWKKRVLVYLMRVEKLSTKTLGRWWGVVPSAITNWTSRFATPGERPTRLTGVRISRHALKRWRERYPLSAHCDGPIISWRRSVEIPPPFELQSGTRANGNYYRRDPVTGATWAANVDSLHRTYLCTVLLPT